MKHRLVSLFVAGLATVGLVATACSGDDGASVRQLESTTDDTTETSVSASAGSSSASSSGVVTEDGDAEGDGGYEYASNVDAHRLVVEDLCPIGDLLDAGDFAAVEVIYRDGVNSVNSDGSVRSIGGFATSEERLHGLDAYYGAATPLDDFVSAALAGTGMFAGESDAVRSQGVEKGMRNQVMVAWLVHELNAALAKADDGDFDVASGAVHNWDEGWAFYYGSQPGCAPFATANSRAANFGTTGSGDTARANEDLLAAMIDGRDALLAEDADAARQAATEVMRNLAITYSQATVRYAHLVPGDLADGDADAARVHQAEGLAFWRVIEPYLAEAGADVDAVNAVLSLEHDPGANGGSDEVRAALEPAWQALGISADDIGSLDSEELASSSASASGIDAAELAQTSDNDLLLGAAEDYRTYVLEQIDAMRAETAVFADAIRAGDIDAAKAAYPVSRRPWERIEPIAGLIEDIDGAVDAREDDFDGPNDPNFTGWHRLEYMLWVEGDLTDAAPFADQLEADLATLAETAETIELPPGVLTVGAQELIEEVAAPDGKLSGEEERYSGTDLYSFKANVEGAEALVDLLTPALSEADPELLSEIEGHLTELNDQLAALGSFEEGFVHYDEVTDGQKADLAATLGELAENLSLLNGTLGLA